MEGFLLTIRFGKECPQEHLDFLNPNKMQIHLMWQYEAPKYKGDFGVYVWQQYGKKPESQYADIFLLSPEKVIMPFKSSQILQDFASLRLDESALGVPSHPRQPWSTTSELLLSVFTVYKQMIKQTENFVEQSLQEIHAMV